MTHRALPIVLLLASAIAAHLAAQAPAAPANPGAARRTASVAGRVIQTNGMAARNARIAIYAVREGAPAAVVGTATSSYDGRYEVTGLPAGTFLVGVTAQQVSGFGGAQRPATAPIETFYPGVAVRSEAQPITVFEGVAAEGIDVWLAPAPQRFNISGRIFWPDDVELENLAIEYGGPGILRRGLWYVSDPGGLFTIEGVSQGTYVLLARADTAAGPLIGLASTDVTLGSVEDVRLTLRAPGSIEGRIVVDGAGPATLADARVSPVQTLLTLSPLYPVGEAPVASDGAFQLSHVLGEYTFEVHGLPAGWRVRRVQRGGTRLVNDRITVAPGERATGIEIVVGPGPT